MFRVDQFWPTAFTKSEPIKDYTVAVAVAQSYFDAGCEIVDVINLDVKGPAGVIKTFA